MIFENQQIETDQLPNADHVNWQKLDPKFRVAVLVEGLIATVIIAGLIAAAWFFAERSVQVFSASTAIAVAAALGLAYVLIHQIEVYFCGYALREHDLQYRSGIFFRKRTVVPINRIQHVEVASGPLERQLGLARLQVFTAGTSGGDLQIRGLNEPKASAIRRYLLKQVSNAG